MKLIIEGNHAAWDKGDDVVFLGRWCTDSIEDPSLLPDSYTVFAPPISSLEEKRQRFEYIDSLFEPLLADLAKCLNELHNTDHSIRYWRIVTGLWLHQFLDISYSRWCRLEALFEAFPISSATVPKFAPSHACPKNRNEFISGLQSVSWNSMIFAFLMQKMNKCELNSYRVEKTAQTIRPEIPRPRSAKRFLQQLSSLLNRRGRAVLTTTYLPRFAEMRLAAFFGVLPTLWSNEDLISANFSIEVRTQINMSSNNYGGFESAVRELIPLQISISIIEGYKDLLTDVEKKNLPKKPKIIYTANRHGSSDSFAAWTAENAELGARLVLGQHGGLYGEGLFPTRYEQHEIAVSDTYISWGWKNSESKNTSPGPAFVNVGKRPRRTSEPKKSLLIVTDSTLRYGKYCWDGTEEGTRYLKDQLSVIDLLNVAIRDQTKIRLEHANTRDDLPHSRFWGSKFPEIDLSDGKTMIGPLLEGSRLIVCTTLGTTQINTLVNDYPTLIFCNPSIFSPRPSAKLTFNILAEAGIYHTTPESVSNQINQVWNNVNAWWDSAETISARKAYCKQFADSTRWPIINLSKLIKGR